MAPLKKLDTPSVLVLLGSEEDLQPVLSCARAVSKDLHAALHCLCYTDMQQPDLPRDVSFSRIGAHGLQHELAVTAETGAVKMIVSDWPRSADRFQSLLSAHQQKDVPSMLVRKGRSGAAARKALILASGGPHMIQHFWAAQELCEELKLRPRILCVESAPAGAGENAEQHQDASCAFGSGTARLVGMRAPLEIRHSENVISAITSRVRDDDLVIFGGPNYARLGRLFSGSIPDIISKQIPNDLVMILGGKPPSLNLKDVFWEEVVCMDMAPEDKQQMITRLIDILIRKNQVPAQWRSYMLQKAFKRESILPTVTDAGAAFPHVTVPDISGIIGALGICPQGVDFGGAPTRPVRFIFLLITPAEQYDDYLALLSDIATIMISPERRQSLMQSRSPREVLEKLERFQGQFRPR